MPDNTNTTVRETHVREKSGISGFAFILGGVVVAIAIVGFFLYGGFDGNGGGVGDGGNTNVNVEMPATDAPAAEATPPAAEIAPPAADSAN
ncbi:hypothetical protein [Oceaniovalibus sp. ACAM 378]|uniref:hypothetical protein n=1 Tax=Oceaniovalibus sp. ACAM 378 TaxID=2599923 RepID=UPI0011DBF3AA|nr:hypothetical protein [Oceaniovalibus sp. ACAM 378]TYB87952.1 hypothetical protein FQ320_12375 [Oceaniovalibus sp. ACAM 378]